MKFFFKGLFKCFFFGVALFVMLPLYVIGWAIYGILRGFKVWGWNVLNRTFDNTEAWEFDIPKAKRDSWV